MAGLTPMRAARVGSVDQPDGGSPRTYVTIGPVRRSDESWNSNFNEALRSELARLGFHQPDESIGEIKRPVRNPWRIVAPGVIVRGSEYAARYGHLDLDGLRRQLSPEVFLAFIRHIGAIEGPDGVDVNVLGSEETS